MKLDNNQNYPTQLPVIIEDELFLYPFMITPIFLSDTQNIKALDLAIQNETMIFVAPSKIEGGRSFDDIYDCGVIGNIMRKVPLPDGRIKILFQGYAKAKIINQVSNEPLCALVDLIHQEPLCSTKKEAIMEVLREKAKALSTVSHYFPPDLLRTIEEDNEPSRICDLILNSIKIKKHQAYEFFIETNL
ncbi:LON peptidase substrate-binding domain-containing protein, partial [Campylobacter volucris]